MSVPWLCTAVLLAHLQLIAFASTNSTYTPENSSHSLRIASDQLRLRDGHALRNFVIALNELHFDRRPVLIDPQPDVAALLQLARSFEFLRGGEVGLVLYPVGDGRRSASRRYLVGPGRVGVGDHKKVARQHSKKLIPNDTYFSRQWHLRNPAASGGTLTDINITNAWDTWRGSNVLVAVVDDGIELAHADLQGNARLDASWDFNENDADPAPHIRGDCDSWVQPSDCHGTAVAGVVAATANNATGVAGVAFEAGLAGLRLISDPTTDEQDAAAMSHRHDIIHIMNNSWGAEDCEGGGVLSILSAAGPLMRAAIRAGVEQGRSGKGIIYVWAGGNGRVCGDDVNYDGFANLVDVIAVGATTSTGVQATYSEPGACLITVAPSNGGGQGITTTDLTAELGYNYVGAADLQNPSYTSTFGGTSAATPIVSGVVALMLEANPQLSHRDVKEILLRTGTRVQPTDSDWRTNTAGIVHSHKFGGGLVNANEAVTLATNWLPLAPRNEITQVVTNLAAAVPDADPIGISRTFVVTNEGARVENVAITFSAPHSRWGDLAVTLISPSGLRSRLAVQHNGDAAYTYDAWTFNTVRHWGEHAAGTWTVTVADVAAGNVGVLDALDLTLYTSQPAAILRVEHSTPPILHLASPAPGWRYIIEEATQLTGASDDWVEVTTVTIPPSGRITITAPDPMSEGAHRFYRARLVP